MRIGRHMCKQITESIRSVRIEYGGEWEGWGKNIPEKTNKIYKDITMDKE